MQNATTLKKHAELVERMATTLGLDLEEAVMRAQMELDDISDAVLTCSACAAPEDCAGWLDSHAESGSRETPRYCRNKLLLETLRGKAG